MQRATSRDNSECTGELNQSQLAPEMWRATATNPMAIQASLPTSHLNSQSIHRPSPIYIFKPFLSFQNPAIKPKVIFWVLSYLKRFIWGRPSTDTELSEPLKRDTRRTPHIQGVPKTHCGKISWGSASLARKTFSPSWKSSTAERVQPEGICRRREQKGEAQSVQNEHKPWRKTPESRTFTTSSLRNSTFTAAPPVISGSSKSNLSYTVLSVFRQYQHGWRGSSELWLLADAAVTQWGSLSRPPQRCMRLQYWRLALNRAPFPLKHRLQFQRRLQQSKQVPHWVFNTSSHSQTSKKNFFAALDVATFSYVRSVDGHRWALHHDQGSHKTQKPLIRHP